MKRYWGQWLGNLVHFSLFTLTVLAISTAVLFGNYRSDHGGPAQGQG